MNSVSNKTVLITGAAKRIGAAIAEYLHQTGMNVIIHHNTSIKEANTLADKLNAVRTDSAFTVQANLEHQESYASLIEESLAFKGNIDVLINNASVFYPTKIDTLDYEQWDEIININLKAPLYLCQLAADSLAKNNGCIINIGDIHANQPLKDHTIYSVSKAGLIMLTRSLAKELAPDVRVNAISPGAITWPDAMSEEMKQAILQNTALKRIGNTNDINKAVLFLINEADYITGQTINIDGGRTLY